VELKGLKFTNKPDAEPEDRFVLGVEVNNAGAFLPAVAAGPIPANAEPGTYELLFTGSAGSSVTKRITIAAPPPTPTPPPPTPTPTPAKK
jgi:hypothetical protein